MELMRNEGGVYIEVEDEAVQSHLDKGWALYPPKPSQWWGHGHVKSRLAPDEEFSDE